METTRPNVILEKTIGFSLEIEETKYWGILCNRSELYPTNQRLYDQVNEIGLIVYKIISSSKNNK